MPKNNIIDNSLVDSIRARNATYNTYAAPQWDAQQYVAEVSNVPTDEAPDDFGFTDYVTSAWNQWWTNHYLTLMDTEYGKYTMLDQDEKTLRGFRDYIRFDGDNSWLYLPEDILQGYSTVMEGRMNDSGLNDKLLAYINSGNTDLAMNEINRQLNELPNVDPHSTQAEDLYHGTLSEDKRLALNEADSYRKELDEHERKISPWFQYKDLTTNFDFTNIDTYLYKIPGLLGSSSATILTDLMSSTASLALASTGGPWGVIAGIGVNALGNLYSRTLESYSEVYQNYKDNVRQKLENSKADKKVLQDARAYMIDHNEDSGRALYTEDLINDDDFVYDQILTGRVPVLNYQLEKTIDDSKRGLMSLYMDNMALSAFDLALSALEVVPLGFKGIGLAKKIEAASERIGATRAAGVIRGVRLAASKRIDDVVSYGLDKADDLSKLTWRKTMLDLGGRMALSSVLEGQEEGVLYIKGQNYIKGLYNDNTDLTSIPERWFDNLLTGARSVYAALTPFDPLYSDDQEFMDNFKGGALLGGLMTGGMRAVSAGINMPGLLRANRMIASLYADNIDTKDRVNKDIIYSRAAGKNLRNQLNLSFEYLKQISPEGITEEDINAEMERANKISNLSSSLYYRKSAEKAGIDPRTEDYNIYTALRNHYEESFLNSEQVRKDAVNEIQQLFNTEEANQYIRDLTERINRRLNQAAGNLTPLNTVTEETVRNMMEQRAYLRAYDNLALMFDQEGQILGQIQDNLNYKTNQSDIREFGNKVRELKGKLQNSDSSKQLALIFDHLSKFGFTEDMFDIPASHEDITKAAEKIAIAELDQDRYASEALLFREGNEDEVKDRISRYKDAIDRNEAYIVTLDDIANGRDINRANHNTTEYTPPPMGSALPQPLQPQQPATLPLPQQPSAQPQPTQQDNPQPQPNKTNPVEENKTQTLQLANDIQPTLLDLFNRTETRRDGSTLTYSFHDAKVKRSKGTGGLPGYTELSFVTERADSRNGSTKLIDNNISAFVASEDDIDYRAYAEQGAHDEHGNPIEANDEDVQNAREELTNLRRSLLTDNPLPVLFVKLFFRDDGTVLADMRTPDGKVRVQLTPEAAQKYRDLFSLYLQGDTTSLTDNNAPLNAPGNSNAGQQVTNLEDPEVTEQRKKALEIHDQVTEEVDGHIRLKRGTDYGDAYDAVSQAIKDDYMSRHPDYTHYAEYRALQELGRQVTPVKVGEIQEGDETREVYDIEDDPKYDALDDLIEARDRMEDYLLQYGYDDGAKEWVDYVRTLLDKYNEIAQSLDKAAEQVKENATKNPEPAQPVENPQVIPEKSEDTEPAKVEGEGTETPRSIDDLPYTFDSLFQPVLLPIELLLPEAQPTQPAQPTLPTQPTQPPVDQQPSQVNEPLTFEQMFEREMENRGVKDEGVVPISDPYSHEVNYRLRDRQGNPMPFQGMEEYANNDELAQISTDPDFIQAVQTTGEFVVRPYIDPNTKQTRDAIYLTFEKGGKKYVASIQELDSLQRYLNNYQRLPYDLVRQILENLRALRDKITQLYALAKANPNLKVVPVSITTTTGQIVNEKNPDGSPKNKSLLDSGFLTMKDPFQITPDDVQIGITTGNRGKMYVRYKGMIISTRGQQLGQPMWIVKVRKPDGTGFDNKLIKLNYQTFENQPEVADLILDLLTTRDLRFIDKNGFDTGIDPKELLKFIVNFGSKTVVDINDTRLTNDLKNRLLDKQFFMDNNDNVIIGRNTYTMSDLISNDAVRNQAKDYIMKNFHWALDEKDLSDNYIGGEGVFAPAKAALIGTDRTDKITIIPGKFELGFKELGIAYDQNGRRDRDLNNTRGISSVGWYIKQGILLTDAADKLTNANMYVSDVRLADRNETPILPTEPTQPTPPPAEDNPYKNLLIETPEGTFDGNAIKSIMDILDGKKPGPTMEVQATEEQLVLDDSLRMSANEATTWLQLTLGVTPEVVPSVIEVTEAGNVVVGRVTEDSILLSEIAPIGTEYHEAWHRVSQLLISDKKRDKIYDKYRKQGLNDKEIDEVLAEDFRRFMLDEAQNYDFETKNWFRRIIDFVRLWARTGSYALANIYNNINRAKYNGVLPNAENVARFRRIYAGEGPNLEINGYTFKHISTVKQLDDIAKGLQYAFFQTAFVDGRTINYSDLRTEKPRFDTLKLLLQAKQSRTPSDALSEVIDKYDDIIVPMLTAKLSQLGIRAIDRNEESTISAAEEGASNVDIGQHTVEGMNISIKDNAPAEVKFFFLTIPAYEIGPNGVSNVKTDPITGFPQFVDSNNVWVKVLKDLSGCRSVKNMYLKVALLASTGDPLYQSLFSRFSGLILEGASSNEAVAMNAEALLTKIMTTITSDVNNFVTAKISRNDQTNMVTMQLTDNTVDTKAIGYPRVWSQLLFMTSGLFNYDSNGVVRSTPDARRRLGIVINNLKTVIESMRKGSILSGGKQRDLHNSQGLNAMKKILIDNLNSVGIGIDMRTLNRMLASGDFGNTMQSGFDAFRNFVNSVHMYGGLSKIVETLESVYNAIDQNGNVLAINTQQGILNPRSIWNNSGFIKYFAQSYATEHATDRSLSSLGPDGSNYYQVSLNNFAKDRLNEIVNDPLVQLQLASVVYNQHSLLLRSAIEGNKLLAIETLINFKDQTSLDTGRDYFSITDREDYLAKMVAVFSDRILFPTVADKKTYHFIRGMKLFHDALRLGRDANGNLMLMYGDNALNALLGYCQDELAQIELCLRQIDDDPKHVRVVDGKTLHFNEDGTINKDWLEPERRIKNFHTPNKFSYTDKNGKKQTKTVEGNGARFLFLTGIYVNERKNDGTYAKKFINFNDPMKSARENLETARLYFFNMSQDTLKAFLSSVLNERVKLEIQTAKDYGLITANENNEIWSLRNVLLDSTELNKRISRYLLFDPTNAEGYTILDMLSDYTINSIVSIQEVERLFSGAPAYYKVKYDKDGLVDVSIDKIKRLGALTSTGLNNRLDFTRDMLDSDEYTVAELKDHEIRDKQFAQLEEMFARSNLKETIQEYNGQQAWEEVKDLTIKEIKERFPEEAKIALAAAKKDVAGYGGGINVADAAVYISPRMAMNLLRMRGVWSKEIKDAFDILTGPDTADTWEANPEQYAKANKVILNAMKYVAFGTRFEEIPGLGIPYFNKMALFPLFKSIATGDIRKLYDRMVLPGREIDMVLFDSAVKAGSRSPLKAYRQAVDSEIELKDGQTVLSAALTDQLENDQAFRPNDYDKLVTYRLKYKYIRQQLETNPHTHEELMLGTQFVKVGMSNLRDDDIYGTDGDRATGKEIKDTIMRCINKLSDIGRKEIEDMVFDKDGNVDVTKLAKILLDDARDSDANDNVLSGLTVENGLTRLPLDALSDNRWLESRFSALISKSVVDIHLPGGAFIQRSAFGLEATAQDVITENMINDGKPLLMINEKDGSMDSVVSINLFKHIIPNYDKMTFRQARQWLIDHNIIGLASEANAIGYRIPTQSIASISALRFVDVLPEIMGDTIVLPEGFTKLTGSDLFISGFEPV